MNGSLYEQFVRSILAKRLKISPDDLRSAREPGAVLPGGASVMHQIDLIYTERGPVADYITVIECKYRTTAPVDQEEISKLAYVKGNLRASKAILVTNTEFTKGALALAESERIALLIVRPGLDGSELEAIPTSGDSKAIFTAVEALLAQSKARNEVVVVKRLLGEPGTGRDLIEALAADPEVRDRVESAIRDPGLRREIEDAVRRHPDIARQAMDYLKGGRRF
jgi:hypothetical protein